MSDTILDPMEMAIQLAEARARIAALEAERDAATKDNDEKEKLLVEAGYRVAALEAERDRLAVAGNALVASLSDVLIWHRDPESSDYNECEKDPCNFCEVAGRGLDNWRAATGEAAP